MRTCCHSYDSGNQAAAAHRPHHGAGINSAAWISGTTISTGSSRLAAELITFTGLVNRRWFVKCIAHSVK